MRMYGEGQARMPAGRYEQAIDDQGLDKIKACLRLPEGNS
jgi:hypothetical protein